MPRKKSLPRSSTQASLQSKPSKLSGSERSGWKSAPPGSRALQEIKRLQKSCSLLIPRRSFQNAVRQIVMQIAYRHRFTETLRWSRLGLEALQEAAEAYLVTFFEDALLCTLHARRVTLMVRDLELTRRLRGPAEVSNR